MHPAKPIKWRRILGALVVLIFGLLLILGFQPWLAEQKARHQQEVARVMTQASRSRGQQASRLPGEDILENYASATSRPEDDLSALANTFANLLLLLKSDRPFRMGANEEFAAALLGQNAAHEVFLTAPHPALNDQGQLIDRWGTPLFFHVRESTRIDIRSAGPDRMMWTNDDMHRFQEGGIHHGPDLPQEPRPTAPR